MNFTFPRKRLIAGAARCTLAATVAASFSNVQAAPNDALLSAYPGQPGASRLVEITGDAVSSQMVGNSRSQARYSGASLRLGWQPIEPLWLEARLGRHEIAWRGDSGSLDSWAVAAQYRIAGDAARGAALAVRASVWGNGAARLTRSTPTRLAGQSVEQVRIESPRDRNLQLDLIGTLGDAQRHVSVFGSVQHSRVDHDALGAVAATSTGCRYALDFGRETITATQIAPCPNGSGGTVLSSQASVSNQAVGFAAPDALTYQAQVLRVGANGSASWGRLRLRAGATYELHDRSGQIDALTATLGARPLRTAATAMLELSVQVHQHVQVFARATASTVAFVADRPLVYNAVTAGKVDREYGYLTVGLAASF